MSEIVLYVAYLLIWRVSVVLCGAICIYLGYRLFVIGIQSENSDIIAGDGAYSVTLKNYAPGTAFALFGAILVGSMVLSSPADVNLQTSIDGANDSPVVPDRRTTLGMRGPE